MSRGEASASALAHHWRLDPNTIYLNHGSFGACPVPVLEAQRSLRDQMEADAVRFLTQTIFELARTNRDALARVINADPSDLILCQNATLGVQTALHHIEPTLEPGDELLSSRHEYSGCRANLERIADRTGARIVDVDLPWPVRDSGEIVQRYIDAVTDRTRWCLLSWTTSPTAMILPVGPIVAELRTRGVETILDAAHGPGFAPLDVNAIGAAFTAANAHKWLCAPKGAAMLHVRADQHTGPRPFRPITLSVYASSLEQWAERLDSSPMHVEFDYVGTDDPTARLSINAAIDFMTGLDTCGLDGMMRRNRAMCLAARDRIANALGLDTPVPDDMLGAMATLVLPTNNSAPIPSDPSEPDPIKRILYERHRIQVPVWPVPGPGGKLVRAVRISAQVYNSPEQYDALIDGLRDALTRVV